MGFFSSKKDQEKLSGGMRKTREHFFGKLARVVAGKSRVDPEVLDELEEMLITSDVGVQTTIKIIKNEARVSKDKYMSTAELDTILEEEVAAQMVEELKPIRPSPSIFRMRPSSWSFLWSA